MSYPCPYFKDVAKTLKTVHVLIFRIRETRTLILTVLLETVLYYNLLLYYIKNFNYIHPLSSFREKGSEGFFSENKKKGHMAQ